MRAKNVVQTLTAGVMVLAVTACTRTVAPPAGKAATPSLGAGFRYSVYGPKRDPGPEYWVRVGQEMAARFPGAVPETIWIVGRLDGEGVCLSFPVEGVHPLTRGEAADRNEAVLDSFDRNGFRVWLQIEPGHARVEELIDLVLARYGHHPSVVGFGIDVEWYRSTTQPEGEAVTDEDARSWLAAIRAHDPRYRLFLKHWEQTKLPPTVRDGIMFVDDSQILPSLGAMVAEFAEWGRSFAPAPVAFQFGYPSDRPWWSRLADPPREIGEAILAAVPNARALFWVDFTVNEVFPPEPAAAKRPPIVGVKIYEYKGDLEALFAQWRRLGITTAFVSAELAGRDDFRAIAARTGTELFVIFPVFYAPDELKRDPDLWAVTAKGERAKDDWVEFACPTREAFRRARVEQACELVKRVRPAGLSLDFIRDFVFWEMVAPGRDPAALPDACYCPHCLQRFAAAFPNAAGVPVDDPVAAAAWIRTHAGPEWVRFKCDTITSMAWEIARAVRDVKTNIKINLHLVPWRTDDFDRAITRIAAQDRSALGGIADFLSPMCYSFMVHRPPDWIASVVRDVAREGRCAVLPSIQVGVTYREGETFSVEEFEAGLRGALAPPSAGVVFWSWDAIAADPAKAEAIRRVVAPAARS
jgi:hypothetical protein